MDAALLKEREAFRKRALALPTVEKKSKNDEPANKKSKLPNKAEPNWASKTTPATPAAFDYKTATPTSSHRFSILHKIVEYLKKRHHRGDNYPISLGDLLEEAKMTDMNSKHKEWLATQALKENEKVEMIKGDDGTDLYKFKPKLPVTTRKELLVHLKKMERRGLGGLNEEDVEEALPDATRHVDKLMEVGRIYVLTRSDKKRVLYFRDDINYTVDEEFIKLWRSVAVDGVDDKTIEDYLQKQGISSMEHVGIRRLAQPIRKKGGSGKRSKNFKKLNNHLEGDAVLHDYSEKT